MGLDIRAKGMQGIHFGYIRYLSFRCAIIEKAYGKKFAEIFRKDDADNNEKAAWDAVCNDDLDLFLFHSDCEGKFTPEECRKIYKALEPIHLEDDYQEEQLENMKKAFMYCAKRRVHMFYT